MICPICFGRKYDFKKDGNSGYFVECKKCHGTGIVESQTNEEWLRSATTEQLAEWLVQVSGYEGLCTVCLDECVAINCKYEDGKQGWMKWLKETHNE